MSAAIVPGRLVDGVLPAMSKPSRISTSIIGRRPEIGHPAPGKRPPSLSLAERHRHRRRLIHAA
jgi:hypothetical protein